MIDAVLWDNDGVLVDTEILFFRVTREAFAGAGAELSPERWMKSYLGEGLPSREIALDLGIPAPRADEVLGERNAAFRRLLEQGVPVRPGVREALSALKGRVRLALVTGSPRDQLHRVHRTSGLLPFFECVITAEDCERGKPAPDLYLSALGRLGLPPDRCLAVEDSARGVAAAVAAGIRCVVVPHELTGPEAGAGAYRVEKDAGGILDLLGLRPAAGTAGGGGKEEGG